MYQTRRQISLLKDKVNIVHQNSDSNFFLPKKQLNLCKINLRKNGKASSHESIWKTSEAICKQSIDKENLIIDSAKLVQNKKQNGKIKQSILCKKSTVINKAKNCTKIKQKEQSKAENCQLLICKEKNIDNFKSLNKMIKSSLIYNKCPTNDSVALVNKKKKRIVDVYDISADDDFRKEELNLKESKKLKLQDKKEKTKKFSKKKKMAKVDAKEQEKIKNVKEKNEIQHQFIKPLTSKVSKELNMKEGYNLKDIPKSNHVKPSKLDQKLCLELSATNKNENSNKLFLREITQVQGFDSDIPNGDHFNSDESLSKLLPHTSTPQKADNPCPTFTATPEFSFIAQISKDRVVPLSFEIVENIESCLDNPEKNVISEEEDELDYVTVVNNYSLVLFGSPEKVVEDSMTSKNLEEVFHFDTADDRKKRLSENKKVIKQISSKWKKPDIVQKKSNTERKEEEEEENFYKSFNEQLSELDNYELCIEIS